MLRKIRIAIAAVMFVGVTLLYLDLSGSLHAWLGWMAKIQFLPAVLALNLIIVALLAILTLVFGRVYCSVICPLGIFQDIVSWLSGRRKGKKSRFHYVKEHKWLRYGLLGLFIVALIAGIQPFVALLAPYSAYGRIVQSIFAPLVGWCNNLLALLAERAGSYAFYTREVWLKSAGVLAVAAATLVAVVWLAWKNGRTWCNSICPVGTTLSFLSRFSLFRPVIDAEKCRDCHMCEKKCKASCIDISGGHKIDYSRCVDCFDCIDNCKFGALKYRFAYARPKDAAGDPESSGGGRRAFLASAALVAFGGAARSQEKKLDGGFAQILDKEKPRRNVPLTPFGSKSVKDFYKHCTACQLCVSACPNNVLRPSQDLTRFMQPEMSYERGYCRPECTVCSDVCPTWAILPLTPEEKTVFHIGTAVVDRSLCIVEAKDTSCGNCSRHCPTGAIIMVPMDPDDKDSLRRPVVNEDQCIGCGACENLCPSRPISAIHVEGLHVHVSN